MMWSFRLQSHTGGTGRLEETLLFIQKYFASCNRKTIHGSSSLMGPKQNTEAFWTFLLPLKGLIQSLLEAKQLLVLLAWWDHPGAPFLEQDFAVPSVMCQTKEAVSQWTPLPWPLDSSPSWGYGSSDLNAPSLVSNPLLKCQHRLSLIPNVFFSEPTAMLTTTASTQLPCYTYALTKAEQRHGVLQNWCTNTLKGKP